MYDVGGTRTLVRPCLPPDPLRGLLFLRCSCIPLQRQVWSSYFDDMNAIIFLAPISCFDEKLAEDRRVNRLEDSFLLWKAVVSNKILARTQLVLFLNKVRVRRRENAPSNSVLVFHVPQCDLLDKKLKGGIRVKDYVPSYGDRRNDVSVVAKCKPAIAPTLNGRG